MDWKTIKCTPATYEKVKALADASRQPMATVSNSLLNDGAANFRGAVDQLIASLREMKLTGESVSAQGAELLGQGAGQGAGKRQPDDQLVNPHGNSEKVWSAEAVAEAVAAGTPEIDESGERGSEAGLASPESENEHETGAGKWLALAFIGLLAFGELQRRASQGFQANRGVM